MTDTSRPRSAPARPDPIAEPRHVPFDAPWTWLEAGWRDLWDMPHIGLGYGAVFTAIVVALIGGLARIDALAWLPALAGGFILLGPFAAVGLYQASHRRAQGLPVTLADVAWAPFSARGQLAFAGVLLLLVFLIWLRSAFLLLMIFLGAGSPPTLEDFTREALFTAHGLGLLVVGTIVGAAFAALVFSTAALSLPMLLVKRTDVLSAAAASVRACLASPKAFALWAALIAVAMAAGLLTVVGLVIAFPLIAHATWRAYADVFGER